jgi:hypothetical protein
VKETNFYGRIYTTDSAVIKNVLKIWLAAGALQEKLKLSGEQIVYEDDRIYVYCYEDTGAVPLKYLIEGHTTGTLAETSRELRRLLELFREQDVKSTFECVEVDDAGEEVSDQVVIS